MGHARCATASQDQLPLDDDGSIATEALDMPDGMEQLAKRGAKARPARIIIAEDNDGPIFRRPGAAA